MTMQCFPLYSILLALDNPIVDYFSLDVEGAEMAILRTIPWDKVNIKVLTIEFNNRKEDKEQIVELLCSKGYTFERQIKKQDLIFVKKSWNGAEMG